VRRPTRENPRRPWLPVITPGQQPAKSASATDGPNADTVCSPMVRWTRWSARAIAFWDRADRGNPPGKRLNHPRSGSACGTSARLHLAARRTWSVFDDLQRAPSLEWSSAPRRIGSARWNGSFLAGIARCPASHRGRPEKALGRCQIDWSSIRLGCPPRRPGRIRVIGSLADQLINRASRPPRSDRRRKRRSPTSSRDVPEKWSSSQRHRAPGGAGIGFVQGFGPPPRSNWPGRFAHDHHNLVVIGAG